MVDREIQTLDREYMVAGLVDREIQTLDTRRVSRYGHTDTRQGMHDVVWLVGKEIQKLDRECMVVGLVDREIQTLDRE